LKVLVTGASGFIAQHLLPLLHFHEHQTVTLSRTPGVGDATWSPERGELDPAVFDGVDAIVHLAGEQVAERWTGAKKDRIYKSRIQSAELLTNTIKQLPPDARPKAFLSASAIGYYGNRGSEVLDESAPPGNGFLSHVCVDWEKTLKPMEQAGLRTVTLRMGIVLSTNGGALPRIIRGITLSAGGRLGSGQQYMSWVTVQDAVAAIEFLLKRNDLYGAFNVSAPQSVTNAIFISTLAELLHCDRLIPVPAAMAQLAFGAEMANELLLSSTRAVPEKLSAAGFEFRYPTLKAALEHLVRDRM
jgi:uncharacterized protein